jgi:hypothetical protein
MSAPRAWGVFGCALVAALVVAQAGVASYGIATGATSPGLTVDAKGDADVTWTQGGVHYSFVVPEKGLGYHGSLPGADVFKRAHIALPMAVVTGKTPDGTRWALQQLAVSGRATSLDLSRWRGAPTAVKLAVDGTHLTGTATFGGHPVTGSSLTLTGKKVKAYVYVECFGCPGHAKAWMFMVGVAPKANGSFSVDLRPSWMGKRYRATVQGQNLRGEAAPDAQTVVAA